MFSWHPILEAEVRKEDHKTQTHKQNEPTPELFAAMADEPLLM